MPRVIIGCVVRSFTFFREVVTVSIDTRLYGAGTSTTIRYPWGVYVSAKVMCPDGIVRKTSRISLTADTFFSVPCAVKAYGKTVAGYMTVTDKSDEWHGAIVQFVPYTSRKNFNIFEGR
jgi:hypothetical protein